MRGLLALTVGAVVIVGAIADGLVKWPASVVMLTVLYAVVVLFGMVTSRRV